MQLIEKTAGLPHKRQAPCIESLENVEKYPYFHVEMHPEIEGRFYSLFGIRVESVIDMSYLEGSHSLSLLYEQMKLIQCMLTEDSHQSLELRYVVHPNQDHWSRGKIDIALIVRHISASFDNAALTAESSWKNTAPILDIAANHYEFSPFASQAEFHSLWDPFEIRDIAEILRREELISDSIYVPCPFIPTTSSFVRLFK